MSGILEQAVDYVQANPGVVAGVCLAVLILGVTQAVVGASLTRRRNGALTAEYANYELVARNRISHNTLVYKFALPMPDMTLGLPLGRHLSLRAFVDNKEVRRPYTPTSSLDARGYFELLVKTYPAPYGLMSRHLEAMQIGESIEARGPLGRFNFKRGAVSRYCMIAGGTGITPMYQVLLHLLRDEHDTTHISLVYANETEDDILLRKELDFFVSQFARFSVYYVLNKPAEGWVGGSGLVTKEILQAKFGEATDRSMALMCGPPIMNKFMKGYLAELGFKDDKVFKF